jgi:hypothetical protein
LDLAFSSDAWPKGKAGISPTPVSFAMNNFAPLEIVQQQGFGTVGYLRA